MVVQKPQHHHIWVITESLLLVYGARAQEEATETQSPRLPNSSAPHQLRSLVLVPGALLSPELGPHLQPSRTPSLRGSPSPLIGWFEKPQFHILGLAACRSGGWCGSFPVVHVLSIHASSKSRQLPGLGLRFDLPWSILALWRGGCGPLATLSLL